MLCYVQCAETVRLFLSTSTVLCTRKSRSLPTVTDRHARATQVKGLTGRNPSAVRRQAGAEDAMFISNSWIFPRTRVVCQTGGVGISLPKAKDAGGARRGNAPTVKVTV